MQLFGQLQQAWVESPQSAEQLDPPLQSIEQLDMPGPPVAQFVHPGTCADDVPIRDDVVWAASFEQVEDERVSSNAAAVW